MTDFLLLAFIFLIAGVVAVPIASRLGLGSVLGYLIAGIVISPVMALLQVDVVSIQHFAEFGVVMMLFLVGLELEPKLLWSMRSRLLGLGGGQVALTAAVVMAVAMAFGQVWTVALAILCEHTRVIQRSHKLPPKTIYDWRHYLAVLQRKPGALRNGAPFLELPPAFRQLQDGMLRKPGGDREMVDILALVLHHDEQAVLTAVELALSEGVPTKTHVLNLLHRLIDGKVIGGPTLDTPQALALHREPKANVERYDGLRSQIVEGRHAS